MDWQLVLIILFGSLVVIMMTGLPVALCFLLVALSGMFILSGGEGLEQITRSLVSSVSVFSLLPLPLFILMGEVMYQSGIAPLMMDAVDKWLGRLPGRLGLLAVGNGTILSTLTGNSMASVAILGSVLVPEMEKRGYKKPMSLGPILGSGGLALMIPPSGLAVLIGAVGAVSIGKTLMAIIIPGLLMSVLYATYIIGRCYLQPSIAPAYEVAHVSLLDKVVAAARYILPLGFIIFMVVGVIFLGIATPTEAAASGALGTFILAAAYRRLNWQIMKKALIGTLEVTGMIFMIIAGAKIFSQVIAFTGASREMVGLVAQLDLSPILIIMTMQVVVIFLGMFLPSAAHVMIAVPLFMPVVNALGFDPVWFAVLYLLATEMGMTSPPYGCCLFVMKAAAPPGTTMTDTYKAALPFLYCDLVAMALIIAFPAIALWLPGVMR